MYVKLFTQSRPQTEGMRKGLEQDTEQGGMVIQY